MIYIVVNPDQGKAQKEGKPCEKTFPTKSISAAPAKDSTKKVSIEVLAGNISDISVELDSTSIVMNVFHPF